MTRNQIWITVGGVAAALALGIVVTLVVTGGDNTDEISTAGTRPTQPPVTTTIKPATTPPPTVAPTKPPATLPPTTPPTVVVVPPTNAPTSPPTVAPTNPVTAPPTTKPTVPPTTSAPAVDPGITPTEVHLAVIADTQDSIAGVQAWATSVNAKKSGIGGRKIVLDPFVVNGDPAQFAAAVNTACTQDFAIVGSLSAGDSNIGNLTTCGIPDLPARALSGAHAGAPNTYAVVPTQSTKQQVGGFRWIKGAVQGCCKQYVISSSTNAAAAAATQLSVDAANSAGVGFTSAGGAKLPDSAPQSDYTSIVEEMETKGATFGRSDLPFTSTINLRTEAAAQSFTGVKAWFCLAQCYQPSFVSQGGAHVDGQYVQIGTNPFEDAGSIPAMKKYLSAGGPRNEAGLEPATAGLLFQTAANQVVAADGKGGLTRAALLAAVAGIDDFNAGGILGLTNVGGRAPNGCFVMMKVDGGKFVRAEPAGAGQLSCGDQNLLVVGP